MKVFYKITALAVALLSIASCEEFQPVFTGKYPAPEYQEPLTLEANCKIADLVAMYPGPGKPLKIDEDIIIEGKVVSDDKPGNFYKSIFIQDETGGIEVKIGRNGLYNDYKLGQTIYVKCKGLTLGCYGHKDGNYGGNGMVQIGYSPNATGDYETSYMESPLIIDMHVIKGPLGEPVKPMVISATPSSGEYNISELPGKKDTQKTNKFIGSLVTIKGLKYDNQVFALLYLNSNKDKKDPKNRIFLSDNKTWGITTWAMSKEKMTELICSGVWDSAQIGSGNTKFGTVGELKGENGDYPEIEKNAYSVSQYFKVGEKEIQIRTSGYCKFADKEIDPDVLNGSKTIDVTGVISLYQGNLQFTLISADSVHVNM